MNEIVALVAQGGEAAAPTTLIGAFITGFIAMTGAVVWFLRHIVTVTIPDLTKTHQTTISELTKTFHEEMAAERNTAHAQHRDILEAFKEERHALRGIEGQIAIQSALIRAALKLPEPPRADDRPLAGG